MSESDGDAFDEAVEDRVEEIIGDEREKLRATLDRVFEDVVAAEAGIPGAATAAAEAMALDCEGLMERLALTRRRVRSPGFGERYSHFPKQGEPA